MLEALLISKLSTYQLYSQSNDNLVSEYVNSESIDAKRIREANDEHHKAADLVLNLLEKANFYVRDIWRNELDEHPEQVNKFDLVITVGGDGTFLDASHFIKDVPIIGVNSDPKRSVGRYCIANAENFEELILGFDSLKKVQYKRLEAVIDGQELPPILNEIFIAHSNPAAMTRYHLKSAKYDADVRGSGLIVCTPSGVTGWALNAGAVPMNRDYDIFHATSVFPVGFLTVLVGKYILRKPVVITFYGTDVLGTEGSFKTKLAKPRR